MVLRENEKLQRNEHSQRGDQVIVMASLERGRSQSKRRGGPRERSQYWPKDMSNVEYYYCGEKGHVQDRCPKLKEDLTNLKKLQEKIRGKAKLEDEDDSDANVIDRGDVLLAKSAQENGEKQKEEKSISTSKQVMKTEGACCECGEGYACSITKTNGSDAGEALLECGNGSKCEIPGSHGIVILKDA
ncbi:hypothetical protein Cgig2_014120 [Carnegiea gigantea]|uniref:CCHC-type domain-containing protein n=1 Tax=Carnegiea gigantea TaxID=171969 RepID=A0A9Q1QQB9_9CARY|nr:hypothetical protein Cgig2_014120 [Carnegiea gigantea]